MTGLLFGSVAHAVEPDEKALFDRFSVAFEASWATLNTTIQLDSPTLGKGTELDFEQHGLARSQAFGSLSLEWHMGRRHQLRGWWQKVDRDATEQILEDIEFGGEVFPVNAVVVFSFNEEEYGLGYTYHVLHKPHLTFGVGGGIRTLQIGAGLEAAGIGAQEDGEFTGPLPFASVQLRYAFAENWRLVSDLGVFYIEISDYTGGQVIVDGYVEHLTFRHWAFGGGIRLGGVNLDVERPNFLGAVDIGIAGPRLYARVRW